MYININIIIVTVINIRVETLLCYKFYRQLKLK